MESEKIKKLIFIIITLSASFSIATILIDRLFIRKTNVLVLNNYEELKSYKKKTIFLNLKSNKAHLFNILVNRKKYLSHFNYDKQIELYHSVLLKVPIKIKKNNFEIIEDLSDQFHGLLFLASLCFFSSIFLIPNKKDKLIEENNKEILNSKPIIKGYIFLYYIFGCISIFISSVLIYTMIK